MGDEGDWIGPRPFRTLSMRNKKRLRNEIQSKKREKARESERKREKTRVFAAGRWKEAQRKKIYKGEGFGGRGGLDRPPAFPDPFDAE